MAATRSVDEFLTPEEEQNERSLHRSRSGGYQDFLEGQLASERRDHERQMRRYYGHRPQPSDRLYVPTFDIVNRRIRSTEQMKERERERGRGSREDIPPSYHVREQKPSYSLAEEPPLPSQLPVRLTRKPTVDKPKIKIIQENPPHRDAKEHSLLNHDRSPQSSSAQPHLQLQYAALQNKMAEISTICSPNTHIEAANPRDLTFSTISEDVKGFAFQLRIWHEIVNVEHMDRIDRNKRKQVDLASQILDRLFDRVDELGRACAAARPRDLKIEQLPDMNDEEELGAYNEDNDEDDGSERDVTNSLGFIIQSQLSGIRMQIQSLSRLTRSLQEATPDARTEIEAVESLVNEARVLFGSEEALYRNHIDKRFAGRKALEEAKAANGPPRRLA